MEKTLKSFLDLDTDSYAGYPPLHIHVRKTASAHDHPYAGGEPDRSHLTFLGVFWKP